MHQINESDKSNPRNLSLPITESTADHAYKTEDVYILRWVEKWQCFLLESERGDLVLQDIPESGTAMKFWSCLGVLMRFPNRDKVEAHRYRITIQDLGVV